MAVIDKIIEELGLSPHPEGGYYKENYRSTEMIKQDDGQARNAGTGIFFLLPSGVCTSWHRVSSDELWHFYKGDELVLEVIDETGNFRQRLLDDKLSADCSLQELVPANCWQRAYSRGEYSLVGCTVAPGFEFEDFEMIEIEELAEGYPEIPSEVLQDPFQ